MWIELALFSKIRDRNQKQIPICKAKSAVQKPDHSAPADFRPSVFPSGSVNSMPENRDFHHGPLRVSQPLVPKPDVRAGG